MTLTSEADRLLQAATQAGVAPGVVALAATADGIIYEGSAGRRSAAGAPMSLDTLVWIASMAKAVTGVAAMQLVEQGKIALDQNAAEIFPQLGSVQVLEGFDAQGAPRLRPAKRPITIRHLFTHTSGYGYDNWNTEMLRYVRHTGLPGASSGKVAGLAAPLLFEPGERWEYGISIDWLGRVVDQVSGQSLDAYMREHIFAPLDMRNTAYLLSADHRARLAPVHRRAADGSLFITGERKPLQEAPEFFPGGGGLHATGHDYLVFLRMLMHGGTFNGARILRPETVALMGQNHISVPGAGILKAANPHMTHDLDAFPGQRTGWGLSFLINLEDVPGRRSAGSLTWAGMGNTYFWLDPKRQVAGVLLTQILPFADPAVLRLFAAFETAVYRQLES
jgi:methyl acetate hydrolase